MDEVARIARYDRKRKRFEGVLHRTTAGSGRGVSGEESLTRDASTAGTRCLADV